VPLGPCHTPLHSHPSFPLPRRFSCAHTSSPPPLTFDHRRQSPPLSTSPPLSRPPKLLRLVKKLLPASLLFLPSRTSRCHSSAAGRPPPSAPCRGRHPKHLCKHMFEFANSPATLRHFPRVILWPGTPFRPTPASAPPRAALLRRRPVAFGRGWPLDRPSTALIHLTRGSSPQVTVNQGLFVKETPDFFIFACRSFHLNIFLQFSPKSYV
jgi:hypothetical protein